MATTTSALQGLLAPVADDLDRLNRELTKDLTPKVQDLAPLVDHVSRYRGKQLRPALLFLGARLFGEPKESHFTCAKVVELIHLATLVHDDILDEAEVRRRRPTVNQLHGNEVPVLLGDYIYALAFQLSLTLDDLTCARLLADVTRVICQGEITQTAHRLAADWTEERYYEVIGEKTASLYGAACRLGGHYAGAAPTPCATLWDFGYQLGMVFQIVDDCLDLCGDEAVVGKSLGTDLATGKLTLPLLYLKNQGPDGGRRLVALMSNGRASGTGGGGSGDNGGTGASGGNGADGALLRELRQEFAVDEAVRWSLRRAQDFVGRAQQALDQLPAGQSRKAMAHMADYVLRRKF